MNKWNGKNCIKSWERCRAINSLKVCLPSRLGQWFGTLSSEQDFQRISKHNKHQYFLFLFGVVMRGTLPIRKHQLWKWKEPEISWITTQGGWDHFWTLAGLCNVWKMMCSGQTEREERWVSERMHMHVHVWVFMCVIEWFKVIVDPQNCILLFVSSILHVLQLFSMKS